jgi:two-component sensor histidine kinase
LGSSVWNAQTQELALARELASLFLQLDLGLGSGLVPCGALLSGVASCLGKLFGAAAGDVLVSTQVDDIALPPYKRRALVLLGSSLVMNSLCHAFRGRAHGEVIVKLKSARAGQANLIVLDDGAGAHLDRLPRQNSLVRCLAEVLDGSVCGFTSELRGTEVRVNLVVRPHDTNISAA